MPHFLLHIALHAAMMAWCPLVGHRWKPVDGKRWDSDSDRITHVCWCGAELTDGGVVKEGTRGMLG